MSNDVQNKLSNVLMIYLSEMRHSSEGYSCFVCRPHQAGSSSPCHEKPVCVECNRSFGLIKDLNRHFRSVHQKLRAICDGCGKSFNRKDALVRHIAKRACPAYANQIFSLDT